jgi:hypothetical protein
MKTSTIVLFAFSIFVIMLIINIYKPVQRSRILRLKWEAQKRNR